MILLENTILHRKCQFKTLTLFFCMFTVWSFFVSNVPHPLRDGMIVMSPKSKLILLKETNISSQYKSFLTISVIVSCFQLLRPVCAAGETFCFMTDACSTDVTCSHKTTCASPTSYCPYVQNCYPTCSLWAVTKKRNGTETAPTVSLKVVKSLDISITATGHKVQRLASPFEVLPGKLIIFHKESFMSIIPFSFDLTHKTFIWPKTNTFTL